MFRGFLYWFIVLLRPGNIKSLFWAIYPCPFYCNTHDISTKNYAEYSSPLWSLSTWCINPGANFYFRQATQNRWNIPERFFFGFQEDSVILFLCRRQIPYFILLTICHQISKSSASFIFTLGGFHLIFTSVQS